jgi:hypothetical protein
MEKVLVKQGSKQDWLCQFTSKSRSLDVLIVFSAIAAAHSAV